MLAVKFYNLKSNSYIGEGFYMPSQEFFEKEYVPKHFPQAKNIGDGKFKIDGHRYIKCEESFLRPN